MVYLTGGESSHSTATDTVVSWKRESRLSQPRGGRNRKMVFQLWPFCFFHESHSKITELVFV